uniref:Uncharacterized protein n=1 Tax=Anguilla anguilla TaxID=7936 RepID=A0A0E9RY61_ANGAN
MVEEAEMPQNKFNKLLEASVFEEANSTLVVLCNTCDVHIFTRKYTTYSSQAQGVQFDT